MLGMQMTDRCEGRRYLVTGASGFIGQTVCRELLELGAEVHGTSRKSVDFTSGKWLHLPADLTVADEADKLFERSQPEFVIHLASCVTGKREIDWVRETLDGNLRSTVNVLVAAKQTAAEKVVLAGSLEEPDIDEPCPVPASPYAASKWCASAYARMMHVLYGMHVAVARIFMVYGPGQNDLQKLVPYVCLSALKGEAPKLASGGRPVDWIYIDDVVDGLIRMTLAGPVDGSYVDLGSGDLVTTGKVAEMICEIAGTGTEPEFGALPDRQMEQIRKADCTASRSLLDWTANTGLSQGLRQTYQWYQGLGDESEPVCRD